MCVRSAWECGAFKKKSHVLNVCFFTPPHLKTCSNFIELLYCHNVSVCGRGGQYVFKRDGKCKQNIVHSKQLCFFCLQLILGTSKSNNGKLSAAISAKCYFPALKKSPTFWPNRYLSMAVMGSIAAEWTRWCRRHTGLPSKLISCFSVTFGGTQIIS